jgi:hypothetical protein
MDHPPGFACPNCPSTAAIVLAEINGERRPICPDDSEAVAARELEIKRDDALRHAAELRVAYDDLDRAYPVVPRHPPADDGPAPIEVTDNPLLSLVCRGMGIPTTDKNPAASDDAEVVDLAAYLGGSINNTPPDAA